MLISRRPHALRPRAALAALVAGGLLAVACGDVGEPDLGAVPSTSTTVSSGATPSVPDDGAATQVVTTIAPQSPPRPEGYEPLVVLSTPTGISVGQADDVEALGPPFDQLTPSRTADDFFGGLVVQRSSGEVLWFPAEGGEGELINDGGGSLLDVGFRDGTPEAILTGLDNSIDRVQLVTRERATLTVLAPDRQLVDLSASAAVFALTFSDDSCGGIVFLNSVGTEVELRGPEPVACPVPRRPTFGEVALSPDGDAYVYTEVAYRSDGVEASTDLVGREFAADGELFRIRVGEAGDRLFSVAFDGRRVAMLRLSLDGDQVDGLVVIDSADAELAIPVVADDAVGVTFARLPLTVGAVAEE